MKLLRLLILIFIFSCDRDERELAHFTEVVVNFEEINSAYDDYNADSPIMHDEQLLHFSSNRNSGNAFDIVGDRTSIEWNPENERLSVRISDSEYHSFISGIFPLINTPCNELGPYSIHYENRSTGDFRVVYVFMYANDCSGNYDIKFSSAIMPDDSDEPEIGPPINVVPLNTVANELYPTFYGKDFGYNSPEKDFSQIEQLLYCSDTGGNFDVYGMDLSVSGDLIDILAAGLHGVPEKLDINSIADDKCPFVFGNVLLFASDRAGGFGGFDLYYSLNKNGVWSDPKNLGDKINTSSDEYRPIIFSYPGRYSNDLLFFSSDRPGGKGGFDLYYSGIEKFR